MLKRSTMQLHVGAGFAGCPRVGATVLPAIDLLGGRVVRLNEGRYDRVTEFPLDPLEAADGFALAGARELHVVDLDAARDGRRPREHETAIAALARDWGLRLQVGGGVRSRDDLERLLELGVGRVLVGSLSVADPQLVGALAAATGAVVAAVDVREGRVRVDGWTRDAGVPAGLVIDRLVAAGVRDVLVTGIDRDGTGRGPDLGLIDAVRPLVPGLLTAAGGVGGIGDILGAVDAGADRVVVGRALYEGLDLAAAIAAVAAAPLNAVAAATITG
jgi:phosphoribosylformimino-5-aminoimidazole carboxamide ribotide isomerase